MLYTAYFQDDIGLIANVLTLEAGTKLLKTNYTDIEFQPSIRLLWTPSAKQSVWAAFTHAVRTPSDVEEDFYLSGYQTTLPNGTPYFARFNANNGFAPEQLNGYELGYRRLFGNKIYVDIASFYNRYHDLFDEEILGEPYLEDTPAPPHFLLPAQFGNGLYGYTKGVEVAPDWSIRSFWRLRGSYSFLHMNIGRSPGSLDVGSYAGIVGSSPQHQVAIQSDFDLSKTVQLDIGYRYVSQLSAQSVAGYSTGNLRLAWRFAPQFEVALVGENLLQPYHFEFAGDPGPLVGIKRSGYAKITWSR
jgi:iron complex outermembrane recepter protein